LRKYRRLRQEQSSNHPEIDKTEDKLLEQLKVLMKDSKNFTDPTLNRKILAERLNTNENYLWETIKKHYGNTIGEYITGLRLNYARELLIQQGEKYTIEAASIDAGFGTRRTFERLFRKKYGLSPEEYRKSLTEK
jgi:transcriptional regulator GlxA family with amidase domain